VQRGSDAGCQTGGPGRSTGAGGGRKGNATGGRVGTGWEGGGGGVGGLMRVLTAIRPRGAGGPSNLAVDEGLDGLDGGDHEGLGGTGEGGDYPADVLGAPAASRSGAPESVFKRAGCTMSDTYSLEGSLKATSIWFLNRVNCCFGITSLAAWIASL
jgi:hypothetical protein